MQDEFSVVIGTQVEPRLERPRGSRLDSWWQSVVSTVQRRRIYNWGAPILVTLIAIATRAWNLGNPASLVFDETFYVKDGWSLWNLGYSAAWPENADAAFNTGAVNSYLTDPSFVVHPPLGKWLIGMGMAIFGPENAASWRVATVVVGVLAVILLIVIAKKLFHSTLLASIAGLLFAIDGNAIVMSRVALLDNFVMFFALVGFYFILLDRSWTRGSLSAWMTRRTEQGRSTDWGPALWWRPWTIAAGLAFGLASGVKWNGLYFLAAFAVYTLVVDAVARRKAGVHFWLSGTLLKQAPTTFLLMVPIAIAAYMSTWITWFTSEGSYERHWAEQDGNAWTGAFSWVPHSLQSFLHYEQSVYNYNIGESRPHPYQANPLTWLLLIRPTSMFYLGTTNGQNGCTVDACGASITGLANPLIWWAGTAALLFLVYRLIRFREWKVGLILMGVVAGYVPWLMYLHRTVFQFYTIAFEPYLILALTFTIELLLGSRHDLRAKRVTALWSVGVFLVLVIAASVFFYPLWTGIQLDYNFLRAHWWLPSWI
jgi:dolichyl-phosphate-mannose--protein O-mannosyl transferase